MNILLDTSVWIRHFRDSNAEAVRLLHAERVVAHNFVIAELACGSLRERENTLNYLKALPTLPTVRIEEVMTLIEKRPLYSRGIGLIDAQLLASVLITPNTRLWTWDVRLQHIAVELGIGMAET